MIDLIDARGNAALHRLGRGPGRELIARTIEGLADEVDRLKAVIAELDDANNAYAKFTRDEGMEAHRRNRERLLSAWQAARKATKA